MSMGLDMGIGMGTQAVGSIMQAIAASQAQKEMKKAFDKEVAQQQRYQVQGMQTLQPGIENMGAETAQQQMAQGTQERKDEYGRLNSSAALGFQMPGADLNKLSLLGGLRANLGGYGDWQSQQGLQLSQLQRDLGRTYDRAQGQASIFPYRMDKAQHSWDDLAFMGQMIAALGGNAANFGALGQKYQGNPVGGYTPPPANVGFDANNIGAIGNLA